MTDDQTKQIAGLCIEHPNMWMAIRTVASSVDKDQLEMTMVTPSLFEGERAKDRDLFNDNDVLLRHEPTGGAWVVRYPTGETIDLSPYGE